MPLAVRDVRATAAWRCTASPAKALVSTLLIPARVKGEKPADYETLSSPCLNSTTPLWRGSSALCSVLVWGPLAALSPLPSQLASQLCLAQGPAPPGTKAFPASPRVKCEINCTVFKSRLKKPLRNMPLILPAGFSFLFCSCHHPVFQSYFLCPVCGYLDSHEARMAGASAGGAVGGLACPTPPQFHLG